MQLYIQIQIHLPMSQTIYFAQEILARLIQNLWHAYWDVSYFIFTKNVSDSRVHWHKNKNKWFLKPSYFTSLTTSLNSMYHSALLDLMMWCWEVWTMQGSLTFILYPYLGTALDIDFQFSGKSTWRMWTTKLLINKIHHFKSCKINLYNDDIDN